MDVNVVLHIPVTLIPAKNPPVFIGFEANRVMIWMEHCDK
jgi:hypothetical protein